MMSLSWLKDQLGDITIMSKNWRYTREWRVCKAIVKRRDKRCIICGSLKNREVHHIESAQYNPELRFEPDNCVTMCRTCHQTMFHIAFKGGMRKKTNKKDLDNFIKIIKHYRKS